MKKYNLSDIMKNAWALYRKYNAPYNRNPGQTRFTKIIWKFSACLHLAWARAKKAARVFTGIVRDVCVGGTAFHPIHVDVDMDNLTVTGNTYPVRQLMREMGLSWDGIAKAWTGSREILNALCAKYA